MIILAILGSLATIDVLCWLLFTLAVFALPALAGVSACHLAHETGAGILGAIVIGIVAAGAALGIGQFLLIVLCPMWLKLLVAVAFVAPAAIAGYHATHGIVKHTMPSETWQIVISVISAVAVGITAFVRMTAMAAPGPSGQGTATARTPLKRVGWTRASPSHSPPIFVQDDEGAVTDPSFRDPGRLTPRRAQPSQPLGGRKKSRGGWAPRGGIPRLQQAACLPVGGWNTDALNGVAGVAAVAMGRHVLHVRSPSDRAHLSGLFNGLIWPKAG